MNQIYMWIKLIFIWKTSHWSSLWNRDENRLSWAVWVLGFSPGISRGRHVISSISSARGDYGRKEFRNCTELWVGRKCFQHTANMVVQSIVVAFRLSLFFYQQVFPDNFMRREILSLVVHCMYVELGCKWKGEVRHLEVRLFFGLSLVENQHCLRINCTLGLGSMKTPLFNPPRLSMNKVLYTHTTLNDCCDRPMPSKTVQC